MTIRLIECLRVKETVLRFIVANDTVIIIIIVKRKWSLHQMDQSKKQLLVMEVEEEGDAFPAGQQSSFNPTCCLCLYLVNRVHLSCVGQ